VYSEYIIKGDLKGFEIFDSGGQLIRTVRYTDVLVILAKEEAVLQGMIHRLNEVGRCCGLEMNVENAKGDDNRKAAIPNIIHDSSNTT
jgi:hypothetical protein